MVTAGSSSVGVMCDDRPPDTPDRANEHSYEYAHDGIEANPLTTKIWMQARIQQALPSRRQGRLRNLQC